MEILFRLNLMMDSQNHYLQDKNIYYSKEGLSNCSLTIKETKSILPLNHMGPWTLDLGRQGLVRLKGFLMDLHERSS